jgi:glycosyltransferase involved in cell wall biosynthesis
LRRLQTKDDRIKIRALSRNFGHQAAVTAGLDHSSGQAVVIIDADLQDPPELIPQMVATWKEGYDVVYGKRLRRHGESIFKLASANAFYRMLNYLSDTPIPRDTGDFRLIGRNVVEALARMPERHRFLRGMVSWVGFKQLPIQYDRDPRFAGETKYPLKRMLRLAADGILSFSLAPLRLAIWAGAFAAVLAVVGIVYAVSLRLLTDIWVSGWTLLFISSLFFSGVQLVFLGVLGEYLGRVFQESKGRPIYLVGQLFGFRRE